MSQNSCPPHAWTNIGGINTCLKCKSTAPGGNPIPPQPKPGK